MAYQNYARFLDPADEPSFEGVTASNIEIEEVEIAGRFLPIQMLADFEWEDAAGWRCTRCFLKVLARFESRVDGQYKSFETEDYTPIHDKPEFAGLVAAAAEWANKGMSPEDFS